MCPLQPGTHGPVWHDRRVTTVLGVIGVLVVLFAVAAVAVRDEALLADAPPDRADLDLPADGPVGAADLERVRFGLALRGYRMAQVDAVLDRLAGELLARDEQLAALSSEVDRLRGRPLPAPDLQEEPVPTYVSEVPGAARQPADRETPRADVAAAAAPSPPDEAPGGPTYADEAPGGPTYADVAPAAAGASPDEPPVEHVPDSGEGAEPLPDVQERPGAAPPAPVPFPEPVHADEPVRAPRAPDARAVPTGTGDGADPYSTRRPASAPGSARGPA